MNNTFKRSKRAGQGGIALLEVLLAILVMAVGVIGAVGLQAKSLAAMSNAGARADATIASEKLIGLIWSDQANLANYAWNSTTTPTPPAVMSNWVAETSALLPNATFLVTITPQAATSTANQVSVTITWQRRSTDAQNTHNVVATLAPTS